MSPRLRSGACLTAVIAVLLSLLGALPAAAATGPAVLVVDQSHPRAADDNPGSATAPLRTISAALALANRINRTSRAVRVEVRPGVYRESLSLPPSVHRTPARMVLAGTSANDVIVSGADVWTGWKAAGGGVYTHDWTQAWGLEDVPDSSWASYLDRNDVSELIRRREVMWVNGQRLRQVLTIAELAPGSFHIDEAGATVRAMPPKGVDLSRATVEVAMRDRLLDVHGWSNVVVKGMTFRGAATHLEQSAVRFLDGRNVAIRDARIIENNWLGLALQYVDGAIVRRVSTSSNGVMGLSVYRSSNVRLIDVENSFNNTWRGRWSNYFGWSTGAKLYRVRGVKIRRWRAVGNDANGLWLDTDVSDVSIRGSFMANNLRRGVFLEALQGPVLMAKNVVCDNGEYGVVDGKANGVTLRANRIFGNAEAQILFSGERGGRSFTTFDTGTPMTIRSSNWTLRRNVVGGAGDARVVGNHLDDSDWTLMRSSLRLSANRWQQASDPQPFTLPGKVVPFSMWRAATGELESTFAATTTALPCQPIRALRPPR